MAISVAAGNIDRGVIIDENKAHTKINVCVSGVSVAWLRISLRVVRLFRLIDKICNLPTSCFQLAGQCCLHADH